MYHLAVLGTGLVKGPIIANIIASIQYATLDHIPNINKLVSLRLSHSDRTIISNLRSPLHNVWPMYISCREE
jgi:hypothetical protein